MQRLTRCVWIVATIALAVPAGAFAQKSLTWQQVKDQFQATNPTLLAGRIGIDEAKAQETTAYLRPNPDLTGTFDQIAPFNANPYRPFGSALPLVSASYLHERGGKRELRLESAQKGTAVAASPARHPEVSRVVMLAPAFGFAHRWAERIGAAAVEAWRATGAVEVFHYGENRQRRLSYALLDDGLGYEDYPDFAQPALIFHGAHDDVVPARYSSEFAGTHPNAHFETLDSGHDLSMSWSTWRPA